MLVLTIIAIVVFTAWVFSMGIAVRGHIREYMFHKQMQEYAQKRALMSFTLED